MKDIQRTQAARTAATRDALIAAGRGLFGAHGYSEVATEAIVRAAGVSRGALYHHFTDKAGLFAAVFEAVEAEVVGRIGAMIASAQAADPPPNPIDLMRLGASAWLDACAEPAVYRIAILDASSVLGWARWREISARYGMGVTGGLLTHAIEAGRVARQPVEPLAHVLLGALRESTLYMAGAANRAEARRDVGAVLDRLILSLEIGG